MIRNSRKDTEAYDFVHLIRDPPESTDSYYSRRASKQRLDQMVDVPYFGDSSHLGLIQLVDFVSFFLRRQIEIAENAITPEYDEEAEFVARWSSKALVQSIPKSAIYHRRTHSGCAGLFLKYAPRSLL